MDGAVPASDLYALGATLIHLITGVAPADLPQWDSRLQFSDRTSLDLGFINWLGKLTEPNVADRISTAREALQALENRHALTPPITNRPPNGSKIQVKKSANQLKISLPSRGRQAFRPVYLGAILISSIWYLPNLLNLMIDAVVSAFAQRNVLGGLWVTFWVVWLLLIIGAILLKPVFEYTDLYFDRRDEERDRQYFEIRQKLFGITYQRRRIKLSKIQSISEEKVERAGKPKGVSFEISKHGHKLTTNPLSTVERHWLIAEVGDWLGLEPDPELVYGNLAIRSSDPLTSP